MTKTTKLGTRVPNIILLRIPYWTHPGKVPLGQFRWQGPGLCKISPDKSPAEANLKGRTPTQALFRSEETERGGRAVRVLHIPGLSRVWACARFGHLRLLLRSRAAAIPIPLIITPPATTAKTSCDAARQTISPKRNTTQGWQQMRRLGRASKSRDTHRIARYAREHEKKQQDITVYDRVDAIHPDNSF